MTAHRRRALLCAIVVIAAMVWTATLETARAAFTANSGADGAFEARDSFGLTQTAPCLSQNGSEGCGTATAIGQGQAVVLSPDDHSLYVASSYDSSVAAFTRNAVTGAVTQLTSPNRCVSNTAITGCTTATGINTVYDAVVSPDGAHLYATGYASDSVAEFARDRFGGALSQLASPNRCVSNSATTGCTTGRALNGPGGIAISPDGARVYVASRDSHSISVFARDSTTGVLTQLSGSAGCITDTSAPTTGCATARGLRNPSYLQVSPDGTSVYVAGYGSNAVSVFRRDTGTGALTQPASPNACVFDQPRGISGCTRAEGIVAPTGLAFSSDGRYLYVSAYSNGVIAVFRMNPTTGVLSRVTGVYGCVSSTLKSCTSVNGVRNSLGIVASADGRDVYAVGGAVAKKGATGYVVPLNWSH